MFAKPHRSRIISKGQSLSTPSQAMTAKFCEVANRLWPAFV
ncbi:hypothetical protein [Bremerella volcania]|nr:hypothetical protein [Bremerella volcania]